MAGKRAIKKNGARPQRMPSSYPSLIIEELTPEARHERERLLALCDLMHVPLGKIYLILRDRILYGNDPRDPQYMGDRMP